MKTVINENKADAKPEYPKLMRSSTEKSRIVLFYAHGKGCVVSDNTGNYVVGESSNEFAMTCFKDFNGTVELSND